MAYNYTGLSASTGDYGDMSLLSDSQIYDILLYGANAATPEERRAIKAAAEAEQLARNPMPTTPPSSNGMDRNTGTQYTQAQLDSTPAPTSQAPATPFQPDPGAAYALRVQELRAMNPIDLTDSEGLMAWGPQWAMLKGTDRNAVTSPQQPVGSPTFGPQPSTAGMVSTTDIPGFDYNDATNIDGAFVAGNGMNSDGYQDWYVPQSWADNFLNPPATGGGGNVPPTNGMGSNGGQLPPTGGSTGGGTPTGGNTGGNPTGGSGGLSGGSGGGQQQSSGGLGNWGQFNDFYRNQFAALQQDSAAQRQAEQAAAIRQQASQGQTPAPFQPSWQGLPNVGIQDGNLPGNIPVGYAAPIEGYQGPATVNTNTIPQYNYDFTNPYSNGGGVNYGTGGIPL